MAGSTRTKPPGAPRGEARRLAILEATIRLIAAEGPCAVTHRRVASEAGVPLAATTYYFTSKDDFLQEAVRLAAARELDVLEARAAELEVIKAQSTEPAKIMRGTVRNGSGKQLVIKAEDVTLTGAGGRRVPADAIFLTGYVRPGDPQNRGRGVQLSEQEAERLGRVVRMAPGATAPLVVSWRVRDGAPIRVRYPGGSLPVPEP